jgi:hypothetical protein
MPTISEAMAIGLAHHQAGRLKEAEQTCRQILAIQPIRARHRINVSLDVATVVFVRAVTTAGRP